MSERETQADKILAVLSSGEWVSPLALVNISLSFTRRIFELRQRGQEEGFTIEMREKYVGHKRRTEYRLVRAQEVSNADFSAV